MFTPQRIVSFAVVVAVASVADGFPFQQSTLNEIIDLNSFEKLAVKLIDNIERSKVLRLNDFARIETISNKTYGRQEEARLLDKLNDISNTKSLSLDLGPVDVKLFRNADEFNVDLKLDPRKSKDDKGGNMLLPMLVGLKVTTLIVGAVTLIGLLTLKAFIASKTAILIAAILGLKKLFGGHQKTTYEAVHDRHSFAPEYHQISDHQSEPVFFKSHPDVSEQKLASTFDLLQDQKDMSQDNNDAPKYEFHGQEASPELMKGQEFQGLFGDNLQEFKLENQQKRRSWKSNGKRKPLSLVVGSPHHEPPVLTYRKVVTGRNS